MFPLSFFELVIEKKKEGLGSREIFGFSVDSKKVKEGECFIGLKGAKVDGSSFFQEAILKGASGLILSEEFAAEFRKIEQTAEDVWVFFVPDTKAILHALAKKWRLQFQIPFIAVTGSVGKTTTKELLKHILEKQGHKVFATHNSENGSIGLPLNILALRPSHTVAIFELGVEKIGEMNVLCEVLSFVTISIITTILESHLKYFESLDLVIKEKIKLQSITREFVCIDNDFKKYITRVPVVSFGTKDSSDIVYASLSTKVTILDCKNDKNYIVNILYHEGFHHCLVAAFTVALFFKIQPKMIIDTIESFKKIAGRFSVHHLKSGGMIINDAYNAVNPIVMLKSVQAFVEFPTYKKKIVVLGDMFDLGSLSEKAHAMILEAVSHIDPQSIEKFFFCGENFAMHKKQYENENKIFIAHFDFLEKEIHAYLDQKYCVLFKASNGTGIFKKVINYLQEQEI